MIERLSTNTAATIKRIVPDHPTSEAVLKFALQGIYNILFIICLTLCLSIITGNLKEVVIILISFAMLRQVSGGKHLKSGDYCVLVTTSLFTLMSFAELGLLSMKILTFISLILVLEFAPSRIEKQSKIPKVHYPKLKVIAVFMIVASFFVQSPSLTISFFVQSLTLIQMKGGDSKWLRSLKK